MSRSHFRNNSKGRKGKPGTWLLIDDVTGAYVRSDEAVVDYKGRLVRKSEEDKMHPQELTPTPPIESKPPIVRPEASTDKFVASAPAAKQTIAQRIAAGDLDFDT